MKEFIKFQIIYNFLIFYNSWFIPDCFSTFCLLSTISGYRSISKRSGQFKLYVNCFLPHRSQSPKALKPPFVSVKLVGRS